MRRSPSWVLTSLVVLVLCWGCSNSTGPTAGVLSMTFSAQHANEGAVLLVVSGGPVDSVESVGYPVYSARLGGDTLKLIVTGQLSSGAVARIHIPDTRQASSYNARVAQVAARGTYALQDLAGYAVTLKQ
jgi:hypothetical protein